LKDKINALKIYRKYTKHSNRIQTCKISGSTVNDSPSQNTRWHCQLCATQYKHYSTDNFPSRSCWTQCIQSLLQCFSTGVLRNLKPCPHRCRKVLLSSKTATVTEKCDCHRKRRDNADSRRIQRQSHFSVTVAVFGDKLSQFSATVWTGFKGSTSGIQGLPGNVGAQ